MSSIVNILRQADIFYELTNTQLELIASVSEMKKLQRGDLIFAEQSAGQHLYVIASGTVHIEIDPTLVGKKTAAETANTANTANSYVIATLRRGQSFGEVALVDEGLRSASARAAQHDTELVVIPREKLMLLCDTYPALGYRLMRNLAADLAMKIRNTDLTVREQLYWMTHDRPNRPGSGADKPQDDQG